MIAAIELALVGEMVAAGEAGTLGYRYSTSETYPDQFAEYLRDNRNLRTPACWATFLGIVSGEDHGDDIGFQARLRFAVVVAAENKRNEEDSRHGDGAKPGSYQLAIDAIRILSRNTLPAELGLVESIAIRSARAVARTEAMKKQGLSMMAIEVELVAPMGSFTEDAVDLNLLHVDWDIPVFGNVQLPLPAPNPDAADDIDLTE